MYVLWDNPGWLCACLPLPSDTHILGVSVGPKKAILLPFLLGIIARAASEVRLGSKCWTVLILYIIEAVGRLYRNILS